jgi:hypothetical protein
MKLLPSQLTIQIHVTLSFFPFDPKFLLVASKTVIRRPVLIILQPVPILHHHLSHRHIRTLHNPIVARPVTRVAQGHQDIVSPSFSTVKYPLQCEVTPNFLLKRTQRSLKLGDPSKHSNSSSISSNIPSSFLTLPP